MTTQGKAYQTRIACQFQGKEGQIVLDQTPSIKLHWSKRCFPNEPRDGAIALPSSPKPQRRDRSLPGR
ncbi:MAG: hypothetical protein P5702_20210 [Limnospira sp. PMC 1291.21]|uniref:RRXRR domain-containing protein n=2 Tax=Limnospira TaxID=2596745 RepID=A0ABU9EMK5_LIMFS|nr:MULTISPECIES: hypothetical protein [Limnospira]MDT9225929.1 hypothetical protein [Limnospira sp. PMC 1279.21]MDT9276976.1 hypothetical protein [Limnospira sp. PMC 737.11]MDT9179978.1 hypothetical protein [Limnospira sp. PMC 1238.20]MDT9205453.1 hypothetical protein [Limnospira sp. PMC 1243.20]MDT9215711.1 hypothetical protein [Limnospira sp. PMC 1256.20]